MKEYIKSIIRVYNSYIDIITDTRDIYIYINRHRKLLQFEMDVIYQTEGTI